MMDFVYFLVYIIWQYDCLIAFGVIDFFVITFGLVLFVLIFFGLIVFG